ncbi:lysophospholipase, putative [Plasmodium knowlesi strain H]|uniref:Lysophospholipase, putative n=3 Tax=Plasmodium knowlesi TaxID=5850 RepID=A0A5K1TXN0_PLAKH|nr:esterase, putative [Plasmodium knowlesi strain H]OTN67956.1 putative Lysophospholipase [Plasmodium knowlesi]CAA9990285.1 esterase, putative [Plasmodium knowlesi strain H]SBO26735.1 lysophospholipase, putative [Plasmodium knowlesi strain H]SBO28394.1 lysophospholipase, putative [Plasmodium knowlesi strain H]VVS79759.1 esterase, putative [Plasmodium knowlesi strain H]|eukprot:XP_002258016.1 lysophospholipase-like protein, putative [Plasmodium knowlesi strain H]
MADSATYDGEIDIKPYTRLDGKPKLDSFFNKDGLLLRSYGWLVKNAIGIIILIHGLCSHARLNFLRHNVHIVSNDKAILKDGNNFYVYEDSWIEHFNKNGYSVYALDLQGHGLSDGWDNLKANVKNFDDFAYDVMQYIARIQDSLADDDSKDYTTSDGNVDQGINKKMLPTYIIGLSMGGNIALRILQLLGKSQIDANRRLNIKGCVSISGMISIELLTSPSSSTYQFFFLPLSNIISDFFQNSRLISVLPYQRYPYLNDILMFDKIRFKGGITYRFGRELLNAMSNLDRDIGHTLTSIPILFIHSKDDPFCYWRGVVSFYNRLRVRYKELHLLENMEHVLTLEPGNMRVLNSILDWLATIYGGVKEDQPNDDQQ